MILAMYNQSGPFTENSTLYVCVWFVYVCEIMKEHVCWQAMEMGVDGFTKRQVKYVILYRTMQTCPMRNANLKVLKGNRLTQILVNYGDAVYVPNVRKSYFKHI